MDYKYKEKKWNFVEFFVSNKVREEIIKRRGIL